MGLRILFIAPQVPASPRAAGSPRLYDLMRGLRARGHSLALVCSVTDRAHWHEFLHADGAAQFLDAAFPVFAAPQPSFAGRALLLPTPRPPFDFQLSSPAYFRAMREGVQRALAEFSCDVVQADGLPMAQFLPDRWRGAVVIDPHDAISLTEARKLTLKKYNVLARGVRQWQAAKIKRYEAKMFARADAYVVNAAPDAEYLARFVAPAKLHVIPNDVDTAFFHPAPGIVPEPQLVFTGSLGYMFNSDAVLYFHANVLPRVRASFPALRLLIVGSKPPSLICELAKQDAFTTVTGFVPDVRPYVWESAVFVSPLRGGTGMKNKLLNAMAMEKPIVATPTSAEGLGIRDGHEMLLAQEDADFANAIARVLNDNALAQQLGNAGRAFVEREYSYPKLAASFEALYLKIMRAKR